MYNAIKELKNSLRGYVVELGDVEYEATIKIDNGRIQLRPKYIIFPTCVKDVQLGLKFAVDNEYPFSVKGGGHSAAGYCLNEGGVVMAMKHLNKVSFNSLNETLTAEMGVIWYDLYKYMQNTGTGLVPVGGGCPTVAPPGFMLGGGYSFVSRSYGMSIDNLISLKIVTANGDVRHVGRHSTSQEDIDLFWACQGGGGGNFGIVVEMEMQMVRPRTEKMMVGQIRFPLAQGVDVLSLYNEWAHSKDLPNEMAMYGFVGTQKDLVDKTTNVKVLGLTPVFNGEYEEGIELIKDFLRLKPINVDLFNMTLPEWEFYNGNTTRVDGRSSYIRSSILPKGGFNIKTAEVVVDCMGKAPSPDSFTVWTHGGGAMDKVASDATAYAHRGTGFIPEVKAIWDFNKPQDMQKNVVWAYDYFERLNDASGATGAYVNYIDPLQHSWKEKYYGENYCRLEKIKKAVDPLNFFRFQQSIGSIFNPPSKLGDLNPLNRTNI